MPDQIQKGDVVKLNSGGPAITVSAIGPDKWGNQAVHCVWFDGTKKLTDSFDPATVHKAS